MKTFWKLPIIDYSLPQEGIIKKQMKFNSSSQEELKTILDKIDDKNYVEHHIISNIDNPTGRIKFKDVRKISIGLCKKDIISYRCKKKGAFYNCFVVILRLKVEDTFKEIHVKVFNTGKLEIPGIQHNSILNKVLVLLTNILNNIITTDKKITFLEDKTETVLINSNFNCGYFINREKLFDLLKYKYKLNCGYDPCSYPGIQCEFHYDRNKSIQNGCPLKNKEDTSKVSFMIFRTGSVLIVGKCDETMLYEIYNFIKTILEKEFLEIGDKIINNENKKVKKVKKTRKKIILMS